MGFLTPILINNDIAYLFKEKKIQKEICEKLYSAMINGREQVIRISNHCNYIKSLGSVHADITRVIIVDGGSMNDIAEEIWKDKDYIKQLKKYLNILEYEVKCLKNRIKELEE